MSEKLELELQPKIDKQKIENEVLVAEKITEERVENSLNYDLLLPEEKQAIEEFCTKVDVTDTTQILQYGATAQNKISKFQIVFCNL